MRVDLFDFELPEASIALRPPQPRDAGRLLVVRPGEGLEDRAVRDLPSLLRAGDALVFNDTRVIPARLHGIRHRAGSPGLRMEAMLHLREAPDRWRAFARPGKRLGQGDRVSFGAGGLGATIVEKGEAGEIALRFDLSGPDLDAAIAACGELPLPPYIAGKRAADAQDSVDYQTVYASEPGAVAAPTAGLHVSQGLLADLDEAGMGRHTVTLHVGAGTFLPVKAEDTRDHRMHAEIGHLDQATAESLNEARAAGGRIVAVGTTALRLLESAADERGRLSRLLRPHRDLHHAGDAHPRRGRADDQLPPAALDPVHAGLGVLGAGDHARRLCACHRGRLSVLFVWRFEPSVPGPACVTPPARRTRHGTP